MELLIFKTAQIIVAIVFAVIISDFRQKKDMKPLINVKFTWILKISYLIPLSVYVYVLATLNSISSLDVLALAITAIAASVAAKGKVDLSPCHTWTGYCLDSPKLMVTGIYAYVRHPIYTGIYLFVIGGSLTVIPNAPSPISTVIGLYLVFVLSFLVLIAVKEEKYLQRRIGSQYIKYKKQVHSFLPVKRFTQDSSDR